MTNHIFSISKASLQAAAAQKIQKAAVRTVSFQEAGNCLPFFRTFSFIPTLLWIHPASSAPTHKNNREKKMPKIKFETVEILGNKNRNGFGSTGTK